MKVFISHSSREDPFAGKVREAVRKGLKNKGHEVFVDMDELRPGDDWCAVLYHRLAECHAAVVLVSAKALASGWVRREVNILLWRRALCHPSNPLKIVPAFIDNLSEQDLTDAGLGDLAQLQIAKLKPRRRPAKAGKFARVIVDELGEAPEPDDSYMAAWVETVASCLSEVKNADRLVAAARELRVEERYLDQVRDPVIGPGFLAHQLLGRWQGMRLERAMGQIANFTPAEKLTQLLGNVAPTWVDAEAARGLLAFGATGKGTVVLNATEESTAQLYISRATCCFPTGICVATVAAVTGEAFAEEFARQCAEAVAELLGVPSVDAIEDQLLPDRTLRPDPYNTPQDLMFLIVNAGTTPRHLVAQGVNDVHSRFPWLVVVLRTGPEMPTGDELTAWRLAGARRLEPALTPDEETYALRVITKLKELPVKASGGPMLGAA